MGINHFERLLVDGTGTTEEERLSAIIKAEDGIPSLINKLDIKETVHV